MNMVNWFEIPASDLARAKRFYEQVFGVSLSSMEMGPAKMELFPMDPDTPGSAGALITTDGYTPSHEGSVVYFSVEDIDGTLGKAGEAGGKMLVPKTSIGEHGFIGMCEDSEGNRIGLHTRQ
jgi:predicted enzyme related to lactoylglutathione lyase